MPEKKPEGFFNESFNKKLPFLFVSLVFFLLCIYTFLSTGMTFSSLFDLGKLFQDPLQFYSIQLILFTIVFAICISLTAFFGFGLKPIQAVVPLALYALIALGSIAFFPFSYVLLFLAFAFSIGASSVFASMKEKIDFESACTATRRGLTVFLVVVILFSIVKIEASKEVYLDQFLTGAASLSPQLAQQVLPLCSQPFSKVDPEKVVTRAVTDANTQTNYDLYRNSIVENTDSTCNLDEAVPTFVGLDAVQRQKLQEDARDAAVQSVKQLLKGITSQLESSSVKEQFSQLKLSKKDLNELRGQLRQVSYFQLVENYFSIFIAFILFSLVSGFTFIVKLLNYPLNFLLLQLSKVQVEAKE